MAEGGLRGSRARETVARYRARAARRGIVRLELQVPRQDAELVRAVTGILREGPAPAAERVREELNAHCGAKLLDPWERREEP